MSPERKRLDRLLERWAYCWMSAFSSLGYPRESVYSRVGSLGTRVANEYIAILQMPDDLMRVDRAFLQLRPIRRQVIEHRYVYFVSLEQCAKSCGMTMDLYKRTLASACDALEDSLADLICASTADRNITNRVLRDP